MEPCEYHGNPGTSFNSTLYHFTGPFLFTFTTFSTTGLARCCCWRLSAVVGVCISRVVFWYCPWPDVWLFGPLFLPCLFCCVVVLFFCCGAAGCWFGTTFCSAGAGLRRSKPGCAWRFGSSRLIRLSQGKCAGFILCAFINESVGISVL